MNEFFFVTVEEALKGGDSIGGGLLCIDPELFLLTERLLDVVFCEDDTDRLDREEFTSSSIDK